MTKRFDSTWTKSFKLDSSQTLSGGQPVKVGDADDEIALATDDDVFPVGVVVADIDSASPTKFTTAGVAVPVQMGGIATMRVAGAVTRGASVHVANNQGYIDDTTPGTVADWYVGIALESAASAGEYIMVLLLPHRYYAS